MAKATDQTAAWKQLLSNALGINAQVIVDVIPEVELVIGRQPPAPELPPIEAQNRFRMVFRRFIEVFADKEHPLVLFLDDLQWADSASLGLLQELLPNAEVHHLLIIGAYRDNEVSPAHPLRLTLGCLREKEARISEIVLGPIARDDLAAFLGDTLRCRPGEIEPLAGLLSDKTAGNPFFAIQFLTALYAEGLVAFDRRAERFQWDVARIREKGFTDNVVDLMVAKMKRLPAATQEALKQLACLGSAAEAATLTIVLGGSEEKTEADLWEAACAGLVLRVAGTYKFLHDRVREAAYSLIPEDLRAAAHLRIGRLLSAHWSKEAISERIFDVANQWNRGAHLLTDARDKAVLFRLNLLAGTKAKAATAYASARTYLGQAMALLPDYRNPGLPDPPATTPPGKAQLRPRAWSSAYEDTLTLYLELSECSFLGGDYQRADELLDVVLANARSPLDRARAYQLRIWLYPVAGRFRDAIAAMVEALRPFGITFPEAPEELAKATEAEIGAVSANLAGRSIADIVDAPAVTDPNAKTLIALLVDSLAAAYSTWTSHFPLLSAKVVNLCLRHGNCAAACHAYANYAIGLVSFPEAVPAGFELSQMALRLNEKLDDRAFRGRVLFLHGNFINYWREHLAGDLPLLEQAFSACLEVGDLAHAGYVAWSIPWHALEKGDSLDEVLNLSARYAAFARETRNAPTMAVIRLVRQFVMTLKGATLAPTSFDDGTFDEAGLARCAGEGDRPPRAQPLLHHEAAAGLPSRPPRGVPRLLGPGRRDGGRRHNRCCTRRPVVSITRWHWPRSTRRRPSGSNRSSCGRSSRSARSSKAGRTTARRISRTATRSFLPRSRASKVATSTPCASTRKRSARHARTVSCTTRPSPTSWPAASTWAATSTRTASRISATRAPVTCAGGPPAR